MTYLRRKWKGNAIKDAHDDHEAEDGGGQDARALLHLALAAYVRLASGPKQLTLSSVIL
jgi:hypothetical protein